MDDSDSEAAQDNHIQEIQRHGLLSLILRFLINDASFYFYQDDG